MGLLVEHLEELRVPPARVVPGSRPIDGVDPIVRIVDIELGFVMDRLKEQHISLEVTAQAKELLIEKGFDPIFGARPLKRTIQRYLEDPLSEEIISGHFKGRPQVKVLRKNEELVFE